MKEHQKTVRVAVIGRTNCGKSTLINKLVGREACPVGDFNDATMKTSIHAVQKAPGFNNLNLGLRGRQK